MGYYNEEDNSYSRRRNRRRGGGSSAFIGAVFGAGVMLFAGPFIYQSDFYPDFGTGNGEEGTETESLFSGDQQNVNVSVNSDITEAVNRVSDSVVGVFNVQDGPSGFFQEGEGADQGVGSGVIYKIEGNTAYVVTNHHVIDGASSVEISLADESRVSAEVVGSDVLTDLAVLEMDASDVETAAELGNSDNLQVGEPALAIGNPLGADLSGSVTQGIISATERSIPVDLSGDGQPDWEAEVLQTDAAINPGNSGGALVNIGGQVIGINSMKIAEGAVEGIGFAIPTAIAIPVIEDLETNGEVVRPQIGIGIRSLAEYPAAEIQDTLNLPEDIEAGIVVTQIAGGSPAEEAELAENDVITEVDGKAVTNTHDLRRYLYTESGIGETVTLTYYRDGARETAEVTLAEEQPF
ncbi:HtrA-like peptidase [Sinobaca qinghaiensis]|uniref:HtrA-like peptidase n=1 Tax=Sinobaca qinghaiensis TaxID=342944 RepID=A0A419UUB2_9BACL|nr:trypsin-like peptidase domain-containing protein [Sinobaca qinghaiensis]RKD68111.1 HtrA-like peptidase [Sinobaca qinghaiensis]